MDPAPHAVEVSTVDVHAQHGGSFSAELFAPPGTGPFPAVVLGAEGTGINEFIRDVGTRLAQRGILAIVPDPYRGNGPADPDDYDDWDTVMAAIGALDFVRAARDQVAAIEYVRSLAVVDPDRVAVWGYCTGATLSWLAAVSDRRLAAAVLFYPSQPTFEVHDDRTPVDPMDLLWQLTCPTQLIYGDADVVMPAELLTELRRRLEAWRVDHDLVVVPGVGHAFCCPSPILGDPEAASQSWETALAFLERALAQR